MNILLDLCPLIIPYNFLHVLIFEAQFIGFLISTMLYTSIEE